MVVGEDSFLFLRRELEACLVKMDLVEKENHELKQEMSRLRSQISTLKAHDLERKSILWKKLQTTIMDSHSQCAKVIDQPAPPKPDFQIIKKPPPQQMRSAPPPPPPPQLPLPSTAVGVGSKTIRRVPAVMEFYRSLMKRDTHTHTHKHNKRNNVVTCSQSDMIGEIEKRSTYLTSIKSDVETYGQRLKDVIREVESAGFKEISEVKAFVKWVNAELSCLVDERAVLKHFPQWPERKADASVKLPSRTEI